MKRLLTILSLTFYLLECLSSQGNVYLYLEGSPSFCFGTNLHEASFSPIFGFSSSMMVGYQFKDHFQIISGVEIHKKGYNESFDPIIWDAPQSPDNPTIHVPEELKKVSTFLEVPLLIKYDIRFSQYNLSPSIGISYGRILSESSLNYFRRNAFNWLAGVELGFPLSSDLLLKIEPNINYSLSKAHRTTNEAIIDTKLYTIGVNFGIIKKIK